MRNIVYMKRSAFAGVLIGVMMVSGCLKFTGSDQLRFVVPNGYLGDLRVRFNQPSGVILEEKIRDGATNRVGTIRFTADGGCNVQGPPLNTGIRFFNIIPQYENGRLIEFPEFPRRDDEDLGLVVSMRGGWWEGSDWLFFVERN